MFGDFWGIWEHHFFIKTCARYFMGNFRKNWATFYSNIWSHWREASQRRELGRQVWDCQIVILLKENHYFRWQGRSGGVASELGGNNEEVYDYDGCSQCDQIGRFIALWATFQSLWQKLYCHNLLHSQAIFVYVSKSLIFLMKSFLGNF